MNISNNSISKKGLVKRINRQLVANFFTLEEFKELSVRKSIKVIKLISRINNIKLSKNEIKEIASFIRSDFSTNSVKEVSKLWGFATLYIVRKTVSTIKHFIATLKIQFISYFRFNKFDLLII